MYMVFYDSVHNGKKRYSEDEMLDIPDFDFIQDIAGNIDETMSSKTDHTEMCLSVIHSSFASAWRGELAVSKAKKSHN